MLSGARVNLSVSVCLSLHGMCKQIGSYVGMHVGKYIYTCIGIGRLGMQGGR